MALSARRHAHMTSHLGVSESIHTTLGFLCYLFANTLLLIFKFLQFILGPFLFTVSKMSGKRLVEVEQGGSWLTSPHFLFYNIPLYQQRLSRTPPPIAPYLNKVQSIIPSSCPQPQLWSSRVGAYWHPLTSFVITHLPTASLTDPPPTVPQLDKVGINPSSFLLLIIFGCQGRSVRSMKWQRTFRLDILPLVQKLNTSGGLCEGSFGAQKDMWHQVSVLYSNTLFCGPFHAGK